jgi:hypothetical protein
MRGGVFGPEKKGCCSSTNVTELLPGFQFAINHCPRLITLISRTQYSSYQNRDIIGNNIASCHDITLASMSTLFITTNSGVLLDSW